MNYKLSLLSAISLTTTACGTNPIVGEWSLSDESTSLCVNAEDSYSYTNTYEGVTYAETSLSSLSYCFNLSEFNISVSDNDGIVNVDSSTFAGTVEITNFKSYSESIDGVETDSYSDSDQESYDLNEEYYSEYFEDVVIEPSASADDQYKMLIGSSDRAFDEDGGILELNCTLTSRKSMSCDLEKSWLIDDLPAGYEGVTREYTGSLVFEK